MDKNEKILLGATCFLAGAVAGFLIAPIKKGIFSSTNNDNNYVEKNDDYKEELDEIDRVLDEVNEAINNTIKEKKEEVVDSEEK